jgi:hypothetical protein
MRTPYTPAPWHYETNGQGNVVIWATRNGGDDKYILGVSQFGSLEQREANARHICSLVNEHAKTAPTADSDLYYLESIRKQFNELLAIHRRTSRGIGIDEVILADNADWLDCFIERHSRDDGRQPLARSMPHETDAMAEALKECRRYLTNFGSVDPETLKQQIDDALATHELREANAIIAESNQ